MRHARLKGLRPFGNPAKKLFEKEVKNDLHANRLRTSKTLLKKKIHFRKVFGKVQTNCSQFVLKPFFKKVFHEMF